MIQPSDEIKSKLDIVDIIRDYIPLKAAGINFRANCPFHHEKSPSFMVSPEKQIWHCFGCGKGGYLISFVMEIEGLSFIEALRMLATKAGVELKKQNPALTSQRNRLLDILELSADYYYKILSDSPLAAEARSYLTKRGLSEKTIEDWKIGFSPESWDDLVNFLKSKNFRENEIFLAGMSIKKDGMNRFYNRFRGRLMFPIRDINGDIVAFTARVMPSKEATEKMGKYINSPQTQIYDKSKILFGLDKAKMPIKANDAAIVMEGQMDVITAQQNNFKNVIASSGTALTPEQLNLLKRYTNNIFLAFDMDNAGQMAADRGIREAMAQEMNIKVIEMPEGKDPDECIKNNPQAWIEAVKKAKPMMQYFFDKVLLKLDLNDVENKREAAKKLLPIISKIGNKIEKNYWLKELGSKIDISESFLMEALAQSAPKEYRSYQKKEKPQAPERAKKTREDLLSEIMLALVIKYPVMLEYSVNHILPHQISGESAKAIYNNLLIYYNTSNNNSALEANVFNYLDFRNWLAANEPSPEGVISPLILALDKIALISDRDFYNFDIDQAKNELIKIIISIRKNFLSKRQKEIEKLLAIAENQKKKDEIAGLMAELMSINEEIKNL
jgi:DNA primase